MKEPILTGGLIYKFVARVFPLVETELDRWRSLGAGCIDSGLGRQALASIAAKRFHAQGGAIYALYPGAEIETLVPFVVAYQTISDYLDNLCDRAGVYDERAFRHLHLSMKDSLMPGKEFERDYYCFYPLRRDGGYLEDLVKECQSKAFGLVSLPLVADRVNDLAHLYSEMQTLKHLALGDRRKRLQEWAEPLAAPYSIQWWEFSAAAGSTLGVFLLCAAACDPSLEKGEVDGLIKAYFPWICGLHILLDYFIDQEEDVKEDDLNFVSFYRDAREREKRLRFFLNLSLREAAGLKEAAFHRAVIYGLLALYLSDPKAWKGANASTSRVLLADGGVQVRIMFRLCKLLRRRGVI